MTTAGPNPAPEPDAMPVIGLDTSTAHPARRYNYWLDGKDNFAADRESGDAIERIYPHIRTAARQNRAFLQRAVRYLVTQAGMRQFLDIGTGLPTADNTHDVAQAIDPTCRIVYVDNDPLVLVHARALLTSHPQGRTAYLHGDLREPAKILHDVIGDGTLDLSQPVAVMMVAVLHFLRDDACACAAVTTLLQAMPAGSYLVLSHATLDLLPPQVRAALTSGTVAGSGDFTSRTRAQVERFFTDNNLALVPPGLSVASQWRPESGSTAPPPEQVSVWGAVARKPS